MSRSEYIQETSIDLSLLNVQRAVYQLYYAMIYKNYEARDGINRVIYLLLPLTKYGELGRDETFVMASMRLLFFEIYNRVL
jgi:hypothetical protein